MSYGALHRCGHLVSICRKAHLWTKWSHLNYWSHLVLYRVWLDVKSRLQIQINMVLDMSGTHIGFSNVVGQYKLRTLRCVPPGFMYLMTNLMFFTIFRALLCCLGRIRSTTVHVMIIAHYELEFMIIVQYELEDLSDSWCRCGVYSDDSLYRLCTLERDQLWRSSNGISFMNSFRVGKELSPSIYLKTLGDVLAIYPHTTSLIVCHVKLYSSGP